MAVPTDHSETLFSKLPHATDYPSTILVPRDCPRVVQAYLANLADHEQNFFDDHTVDNAEVQIRDYGDDGRPGK